MNDTVLDRMLAAPFVPTVLPLPADILCQFARVLAEEGYPSLEILSRPLDQSLAVLREIAERPERDLLDWGLGTILDAEAAEEAVVLHPDFLVSPAFSHRVLRTARYANIPYIPGVLTFQDVQAVWEAFEDEGLTVRVLKLCPIERVTPGYVKMLAGCYPGIHFCSTGEVTPENFLEWRTAAHAGPPMGSEFVPLELLESRNFVEVGRRLRKLREMTGPPAMPQPVSPGS